MHSLCLFDSLSPTFVSVCSASFPENRNPSTLQRRRRECSGQIEYLLHRGGGSGGRPGAPPSGLSDPSRTGLTGISFRGDAEAEGLCAHPGRLQPDPTRPPGGHQSLRGNTRDVTGTPLTSFFLLFQEEVALVEGSFLVSRGHFPVHCTQKTTRQTYSVFGRSMWIRNSA